MRAAPKLELEEKVISFPEVRIAEDWEMKRKLILLYPRFLEITRLFTELIVRMLGF